MCLSVPLHKVWLNSKFVTGEVIVDVTDILSISGVDVLLGVVHVDAISH